MQTIIPANNHSEHYVCKCQQQENSTNENCEIWIRASHLYIL